MNKPRFSTLCKQAQERINKEVEDLKAQIARLENTENKAAEFFASGMSFAMNIEDMDFSESREVLHDLSGAALGSYLEFIRVDKPSKYIDSLCDTFYHDPEFAHAMFLKGYDYECEYVSNQDEVPAFHSAKVDYDEMKSQLTLCELLPTDERKPLHVSDEQCCNSSIIKRDGKYGVFVIFDRDMYSDSTNWGTKHPFVYDDVRIACESTWSEDDMGFVAAKKDEKWGIIDVTQEFELQVIVDFVHLSSEEAINSLLTIIGRKLRVAWESFGSYDFTKTAYSMMPQENYEREYTPENITSLNEGEIFVFGSNIHGQHGGGAARFAYEHFDAEWGVGEGLTGKCYALPTMEGGVDYIEGKVMTFIECAKEHPELKFYVTPVACGIAGFSEEEIAPLFRDAMELTNVVLPKTFVDILSE